jgi:hypothetical protein
MYIDINTLFWSVKKWRPKYFGRDSTSYKNNFYLYRAFK